MFKKVLIANRGEIALRVQRTCWEMGIEPVAIYTPVDREALHVHWGGQAYPLESPSGYLDVEEILAVARASGAQAIHPEITSYIPPGGYGVRVDSATYSGCPIPSCYDSLFGKLIAWGRDRGEAIRRMQRALEEITVTGIVTTIPFHRWAMASEAFQKGRLSTAFVDTYWLPGQEIGKMA